MKKQAPSIFNDIVGPFMVGPSSSHTCGPSRIGYLSQQLLNSPLKKAVIKFPKKGAYTNMYRGQKSDLGFINGLLGYKPEDPKLRKAFEIADEKNISINFKICDYNPIVPNIAKLELIGEDGETVNIHSDSTGSGTVKILKIDGFDTSIVGDAYELLIKSRLEKSSYIEDYLRKKFKNNEGFSKSKYKKKFMFNIKLREKISKGTIEKIKSIEGILWVRLIKPILTVTSNTNIKLPFKSAKELKSISKTSKKNLAQLGIEYEMVRSGWNKKEVIDYMKLVIETMENSVKKAIKGNLNMDGIIKPTAGNINNYIKSSTSHINMGVLETAVPWSMAAMESSNAMGVVVCAPTGGSAGVFPGAILGTANHMGLSMKKKIEAMFVTSIIGIVMAKDFMYSAELFGCQVEPGAASAMASGGLVHLLGGTAEQSLSAASCAVQNILGTICDPVAGLVEIPCISRNAMSVGNAVICANIVMGGYDPIIPLDESTETMFRVGQQLPSELRCTCEGGLCTTSTGQRLAKEQDKRNNSTRER